MGNGTAGGDDFLGRLPLPIAHLYRRAHNAKTAQDRHHYAFYMAEAGLKLSAGLRIAGVLESGLEPRSPLAQSLEQLCLPSVGHWVGFLRDATDHLRRRPDGAPALAEANEALVRTRPLPAVQAFAERASCGGPEESPPLGREQAREAGKRGVLGFFDLIAAYRNQVFGHGSQRLPAFYENLGALLLSAACEVLRSEGLFGGLTLAVAQLVPDAAGQSVRLRWKALHGLAGLILAPEAVGPTPAASEAAVRAGAGQVFFVAPGVRMPLHPLVVYLEDRTERERVGFLNRTVTRRRQDIGDHSREEVRRCEYLDYATGDQLREIDARAELTRLLARLRGRPVDTEVIDGVIQRTQTEPLEQSILPGPGAALGDFELDGELGRGGMGVVYRARQCSLNRWVALKVLPPALAGESVALTRFRREITALARCDHPNLVKILTSGSDGGRHYYAMELVEGANLADLLDVLAGWGKGNRSLLRESHLPAAVSSASLSAGRRRREESDEAASASFDVSSLPALPARAGEGKGGGAPGGQGRPLPYRLGELFAEVADALAHLHERGVLHRDVKPGNVMLTADGRRLVLMDLGLARLDDESRGRLTRTRQFVGTLRYASPEQMVSADRVDVRSDVYSLGATLYELLALRPLYGDGDPSGTDLIRRIQFEEPRRIRAFRPEVPDELEAIVFKCLEKDPRRRYATAGELADDLGRWRRGEAVRARRRTAWRRLRKILKKRRWALAVAAAVLAGLALAYALFADADYQIPGGEKVRDYLDGQDASAFRPAPAEATIRHQAAPMRVAIARTLLDSCPEYPGWWDGVLHPDGPPAYDAWTQTQTTAALLGCPETDAASRRLLARNLVALFDPPDGRLKPFEPGQGWMLFQVHTGDKPYPSGIGTAWALPALAEALARPDDLDPRTRDRLLARLDRLEETLECYRTVDPLTGRPGGAWNLFAEQVDPGRPNLYVATTMFLGLLELHRAGLPWRGDPDRRDELLRSTHDWVVRARRVLGHLVLTLGPQAQRGATSGATFVAAETLIGLSALPPE